VKAGEEEKQGGKQALDAVTGKVGKEQKGSGKG